MKTKETEKDKAPSPQPEKVFYDNRIKRKNVLALNEKVAAIREYEKMPVYKRIGRMFHCSPDQIKRIVQQKDNILKAWEQRTRRCQDSKTLELKVVRVSMLGKAVYDWIRRMMYYKDFMVTDGLIQKMALQFKSAMGLQNFFPHQEWCDKFRHTYKITENDSKLLNIGYTQGYSVQIKDVMKDVLSECTPDRETDNDFGKNVENFDNDGADGADGDGDMGGDSDSDRDCDSSGNADKDQDSKEHIVLSTNTAALRSTQQDSSSIPSTAGGHQQQQTHPSQNVSLSQVQSTIRQLVALPIKTNTGITQKVLVATPITPGTIQKSSGVGVGSANSAPMTMTIIPFTTLAQAQQQPQNVTPAVTIGNANRQRSSTAGAGAATASERPLVPAPIVEIKQEIKKEIEDIEIKQEYISDDEAQDITDTALTAAKTAATASAAKLPEGAAVKVNISHSRHHLASIDDASIIDDDNMALANLRKLIRQPAPAIAAAAAAAAGGSSSRTSARTKKSKLRSTPVNTDQNDKGGGNTCESQQKTTTPTVAATKATLTLRTANCSAAAASNATAASHTRKRRASTTPASVPASLPPIKTCSEARRYLKLLEDFALYKENFRLIGLITRADEVLRELDGENDVDID